MLLQSPNADRSLMPVARGIISALLAIGVAVKYQFRYRPYTSPISNSVIGQSGYIVVKKMTPYFPRLVSEIQNHLKFITS